MGPLIYSLRNCLNRIIKDIRKYIGNLPRGAVQAVLQTLLQTSRKSCLRSVKQTVRPSDGPQMGYKLDLKGRQGASAKRANGDFLSRGWKIVIGQFNCLLTGRSRTIGTPSVSFYLFYNLQVELIYVNQGFKSLIRLCLSYSVCWVVSAVNLFNLRNLISFVGLI